MRRVSLVSAVMIFAALTGSAALAQTPARQRIFAGPWLQNPTQNSIVVMWETTQPGPSRVDFGESEGLGLSATDENASKLHEVAIAGLATGTKYFYRVSTSDAAASGTFRTAPRESAPFRFAVWGDNRTDIYQHTIVTEGIRKANPDIAVNVGDIVTDGSKYDSWVQEFFNPAKKLLRNVPFYVAIGNHEKNGEWFYRYLSQPSPENYFSFNYGNAHFTVLDSNLPFIAGMPSYEFLKKDLQSDGYKRARRRFVFMHHPIYGEGDSGTTGDPVSRKALQPLFEKYKVDIVFQGHIHDYERGSLNGVMYVVSGGGGAPLDTKQQDVDFITVYKSTYQFCTVDIDGDKLRFDSRTPDGKSFDSFELP